MYCSRSQRKADVVRQKITKQGKEATPFLIDKPRSGATMAWPITHPLTAQVPHPIQVLLTSACSLQPGTPVVSIISKVKTYRTQQNGYFESERYNYVCFNSTYK